jgi:hypothetical protein
LTVTAAVLSVATWADGIDPKVIIQGGTGSTPISLTNPTPTVTATAQANTGQCFFADSAACVIDVFQNQTGITIKTLTVAITDISDLVFTCGPSTALLFFNNCYSRDNGSVTDIFFNNTPGSPFHGVDSAVFQCSGEEEEEEECQRTWVGGEFSVDIEGKDLPPGTSVTTHIPEPGSGMMILFGVLAFGLIKFVRRGLIQEPI